MQAVNYKRRAEEKLMLSLGITTRKSFRRHVIKMRRLQKEGKASWPYAYSRELRRMINTKTGDRL